MTKQKEKIIEAKDLRVRKKYLENKSRKGWYYYIKEKGKRPAYYKVKEGVTLDNYLLAYDGKIKIKKKGVLEYNKETPAEKYLKHVVKDKRRIDKLISKGITETAIENLNLLDRGSTHKAYMKMLEPLVKDKELLEIIALEENIKKFKHRIQTNIIMKSADGKVEIELKTFNKTIDEIRRDLKGLTKQDIFESDLKAVMNKGYKLASIPSGFDLKNYEKNYITQRLTSMKIKLRFVKGK